jgi:hypothetical protein
MNKTAVTLNLSVIVMMIKHFNKVPEKHGFQTTQIATLIH